METEIKYPESRELEYQNILEWMITHELHETTMDEFLKVLRFNILHRND